jgi:hypothetical protein
MSHPLQDLYDQIPDVECKGHCGRDRHDTCCGPIACTHLEAELLDNFMGITSPWEPGEPGYVRMEIEKLFPTAICPHLGIDGRCLSYEVRPLICRLWGVIPQLRCPWGCKPKKLLSSEQAGKLLDESIRRSVLHYLKHPEPTLQPPGTT